MADMLGPNYSYADELPAPSELGIGRDGSLDGIMRAVGGINYYVDAIGFGESTMIARNLGLNQQPLGVRYFMKTGQACSNGADMYEYISTVPPGLGGRIGKEVKNALGVDMRGMAPGIMSDAVGALNPMPLFQSVISGGYPQCKKVTKPVGDMRNSTVSHYDSKNVWIKDKWSSINGVPAQTRWVLDKYLSQEQYDAAAKTEQAGTLPETTGSFSEGFMNAGPENKVAAGLLFAVLFLGIVATVSMKV
jgi:hypothetical protein